MNISIMAEPIFHIGNFAITNSMLSSFVVVVLVSLFFIIGSRKLSFVPKGIQNAIEMGIEALYNLTESIIKDEKFSRKIFPLIATFFIFILFNNWSGLIPGFGTIGFHEVVEGKKVLVPIFRAGTSDLNTTLILGLTVVVLTQIFGIAALGAGKYAKKFFNFSSPIACFVGFLELISEFVRIISFAFRLFGNVFAGEVLLIVISSLIPIIIPAPFYAMELFVGGIQALVFTMLALVFFSMARAGHVEEAH